MMITQILAISPEFRHLKAAFRYPVIALAFMSVLPASSPGQNDHAHGPAETGQQHQMNPEQQRKANALIKIVRASTERFKDVAVAEAEQYKLQFGCVSGDYSGAMGLHYINMDLVNSGVVDATHPQIVIYEATPGGGRRLIGADFLVLADGWNATHSGSPELMGQLFHLFDSPNRFGLPAFYTLHVWAWKENPQGAFVNWHPNVSCESFAGEDPDSGE